MPPLASEFLVELARHRSEQPRPLPTEFRPLADHVVGPRRVTVSTDPASRRALRRVGKAAATTGEVIHLDRAPALSPPEVIAHELAHVAHPSPTPRFYADPVRSPEEHRAEELARVMRAAPILPRASGAADAAPEASRDTATPAATIRRSVSGPPKRTGSSGATTVTASEFAARLTGTAPPAIQRFTTISSPAPTVAGVQPPVSAPHVEQAPAFDGVDSTDTLDRFERILDMLEERIIVELERRGGRFRGGF